MASPTPPAPTATKKSITSLPTDQVNIAATSRLVSEIWTTKYPNFNIVATNLANFTTLATRFGQNVTAKSQLLGKRKVLSQSLVTLNKEMDAKVKYLKSYLKEEFGEEAARSYYASFGLVSEGKSEKLPSDRDRRVMSLKAIVSEIGGNVALSNKKYGLTYWTTQLNELETQWQAAKNMDSDLSAYTDILRTDQAELKVLLLKIKQQLKLNSGNTYKQVWREWGFQTEKYK
jgi:hypothetical protein